MHISDFHYTCKSFNQKRRSITIDSIIKNNF